MSNDKNIIQRLVTLFSAKGLAILSFPLPYLYGRIHPVQAGLLFEVEVPESLFHFPA